MLELLGLGQRTYVGTKFGLGQGNNVRTILGLGHKLMLELNLV